MNFYGGGRCVGKSDAACRNAAIALMAGMTATVVTMNPSQTGIRIIEYLDMFGQGSHEQLLFGLQLVDFNEGARL